MVDIDVCTSFLRWRKKTAISTNQSAPICAPGNSRLRIVQRARKIHGWQRNGKNIMLVKILQLLLCDTGQWQQWRRSHAHHHYYMKTERCAAASVCRCGPLLATDRLYIYIYIYSRHRADTDVKWIKPIPFDWLMARYQLCKNIIMVAVIERILLHCLYMALERENTSVLRWRPRLAQWHVHWS